MTRVMVPKGPRADMGWLNSGPPLPEWLTLRDYQLDAVERVVKEYERGARVVFLDAPTGTGKTAIAELVRRRLRVDRALYVCTTKSLQEQVARDFGYARVLKGRANYTPTKVVGSQRDRYDALRVTCKDCDAGPADDEDRACSFCFDVNECPYRVAQREARHAPLAVLNTSLLLTSREWRDNQFIIADECDLLEDELLGYVETRVGKQVVKEMGLEVPKKGSHMTTIRTWLENEVRPGLVRLRDGMRGSDVASRRQKRQVNQLITDVQRVIDRTDGWVRDGDEEGDRSADALVLKPVSAEDMADKHLWGLGNLWLCMSGTVVSADTLADNLGLTEAGIEWGVVELPMRFARDNRVVKYVPTALMTRKGLEADAGGMDKMLKAVEQVVDKHSGDNILVHTHTYKLAREVSGYLRAKGVTVTTYQDGYGRADALSIFRQSGGVLVAPSMDRGIDLPGDLCRVQIIVKVPMASLGSRQVSERLRTPGGDSWYLANTVRTLMQMTGRAVRGDDDWAVTYILDAHFGKVLGDGKRRGMWPQWWLDALELGRLR